MNETTVEKTQLVQALNDLGVEKLYEMDLHEVPDSMHVMLYVYGDRKRNDEVNAQMHKLRGSTLEAIGLNKIVCVPAAEYTKAEENLKHAKEISRKTPLLRDNTARIDACQKVLKSLLDKAFDEICDRDQAGQKTFLEMEFNERLKKGEIGLKTKAAPKEISLQVQATRIILASWFMGQGLDEKAAERESKKKTAWNEVTKRLLIQTLAKKGHSAEDIKESMEDITERIPEWIPKAQANFKDEIDQKVKELEEIKKNTDLAVAPVFDDFDL